MVKIKDILSFGFDFSMGSTKIVVTCLLVMTLKIWKIPDKQIKTNRQTNKLTLFQNNTPQLLSPCIKIRTSQSNMWSRWKMGWAAH
jgi:hypothetical protein